MGKERKKFENYRKSNTNFKKNHKYSCTKERNSHLICGFSFSAIPYLQTAHASTAHTYAHAGNEYGGGIYITTCVRITTCTTIQPTNPRTPRTYKLLPTKHPRLAISIYGCAPVLDVYI